jgi:hypothetical protein
MRAILTSAAVLVLLFAGTLRAQPAPRAVMAGYALNDVAYVPHDSVPMGSQPIATGERKSPLLAAGLSFLVPGLGEYYCGEQFWRGLIFTGLEAGFWIMRSYYNHRGDDSNAAFDAYSDAHYSKAQYVNHMDSIQAHYSDSNFHTFYADPKNCSQINYEEYKLDSLSQFGHDQSINDWGHRTLCSDPQQYYEDISKYYQFMSGWDNAASFNQAAVSRENMNSQYGIATSMLWCVIVNHMLSAIDAALLARDHNSAIRMHGDIIIQHDPNGLLGVGPRANIEWTF